MLRFGQFTERPKQVSTTYGVKLICGSEAYTSKQCGKCGSINDTLKGAEVFKCRDPMCTDVADRDVHAARNIFLRLFEKYLGTADFQLD